MQNVDYSYSLQPLLCWFEGVESTVFSLHLMPDGLSLKRIITRVVLLTDNGNTLLDTTLPLLRQKLNKPLTKNQRKNLRFCAGILTKTQCNKFVSVSVFFNEKVVECVKKKIFIEANNIMMSGHV